MSTDQPDKKPLEGPIDLKKSPVNEKPLTEKNAAATAAERWQAELAKAQLPSNVRMTVAHPGINHDLPMLLASANVQPGAPAEVAGKAAGKPEVKAPVAKPEVKAAPPVAAHNEVKAIPAKPPEAPESGFMSGVHWLENKASSTANAVKNYDYVGGLQSIAASPGNLTNVGFVANVVDEVRKVGPKQIYDKITHTDAKTLATDAVVVGGALVVAHYGGAALEKTGLAKFVASAEKEEGGVAQQILEGKPAAASVGRLTARAATPRVATSLENFSGALDAVNDQSLRDFSSVSRLTPAAEGLGGTSTRLSLRASSSPVLETPISRLPVTRTGFGVPEPVVPKIPVGLKPGTAVEAAGIKPTAVGSRVPTFREFSAEPPRVAGQQVRLAPEHAPLTTEIKTPQIVRAPGDVAPTTGVGTTARTTGDAAARPAGDAATSPAGLPEKVVGPGRVPAVTENTGVLHGQPKVLRTEPAGGPEIRQNVAEPIDVRPAPTGARVVADTHVGTVVPAQGELRAADAAATERRLPGPGQDLAAKPKTVGTPHAEPLRVATGTPEPVRANGTGVGVAETGTVRRVADAAPQPGAVARTSEITPPGSEVSTHVVPAGTALRTDEAVATPLTGAGASSDVRVAAKLGEEKAGAEVGANTAHVTTAELHIATPGKANLLEPTLAVRTGAEANVVSRVGESDVAESQVTHTSAVKTGEPAALQTGTAARVGEPVSDPLHPQGEHVENAPTLRVNEVEPPATVQPRTATTVQNQSAPLPKPLAPTPLTGAATGAERSVTELPNPLEIKEPVGSPALRVNTASAESAVAHADLTTGAGIATETRAAVQQSATELNRLQTIPGLSTEAAQTARTLETNLAKMSGENAATMSVTARSQAMSDIENGLKNLKTEVKGVDGAEQSLTSIDTGVTRLRAANDAALSEASATASKAIAGDLRKTVEAIPSVEPGVAQSINNSLERIAAPEASVVEKRAALNELSTNVEKLRATTEPQTFAAMEKQVAELRTANSVGETVAAQTEFEASATRLGDAAQTARTTLGSDAASTPAVNALERIEQNSTTLAVSRASTVAERQTAMKQIEADMNVLRESPAAAEVPQLERELATMRTSESSVNLLKSETTFAEATPKFSSAIDEALAKPGISTAERAQLESLRTTAARLEPSTYAALSDTERATVLTDAESQVATLERQTGDAAGLRQSLNEVKSSASDLERARVVSTEEEAAAAGSQVSARVSATDPALSQARVQTPGVTDPVAVAVVEPNPAVVETNPLGAGAGAADRAALAEQRLAEQRLAEPRLAERNATEIVKPADALATDRVASEEVAAATPKPAAVTGRVAADVDNAALNSADATVARSSALAENEAAATRAVRTGEQGIAAPLATESEAASVRAAALEAPESRLAAQTTAVVTDSAAAVKQSTQALKDSLDKAVELNGKGSLSGDAALADRNLAAMQAELAADHAPNIALLREQAAALPVEASAPLLSRIDGLTTALKSQDQLATLDKAVKTLDGGARALTAQLSQLNIPGMASTISDLRSGVVSLTDARDRAAVLKSMAEKLATLSPSLDSDVARRLSSTIDELQRTNSHINAALVDVIGTQVARARDVANLAQAKDSLRILTAIVPDGSATSQLIRNASDQLAQAEKAQQAADAALEARRSVFASPTSEQQLLPVRGLQSNIGRLFSLQTGADAIAAARYPRSFAATTSPLLLTGGTLAASGLGLGAYAYFNQSPTGTISGPTDLVHSLSDKSTLDSASISGDNSGSSNQATFSLNTEAALSPLTMAAIQDKNIQYNTTLAPNWEAQNKALGYFATPFSPDAPQEAVAQTIFAPVRKLNLSTTPASTDVKPRLVYPGFAQRQLNEMAAARRRGGLLSVFADNSTGVRGFGNGLQGGPQSGTAARIPTGLSKLLNREIISNGLDANGETTSSAQGPTANDPKAVTLSLANEDNTPPTGVQSASTTASLNANRAKSVAV